MWKTLFRSLRSSSSLTPKPQNLTPFAHNPSHIQSPQPHFLLPTSNSFSSSPSSLRHKTKHLTGTDHIADSLSKELLKPQTDDAPPLLHRLNLHFSHIRPTPSLLLQVLNQSPDAARNALDLHKWVATRPGFTHSDETYSYLVDYFGRRKDFKVIHDVLVDGRGVIGVKTLGSVVNRYVRAGRETQAVGFFERMERDYGFVRDKQSLKMVVAALCEHGFAGHAEKMVKSLANEFFPDEEICDLLVRGWCVDGKLDEAKRLAGEIYRGGFELGTVAYNSILDCVCKLCRKKDPFRMEAEAEKVLIDMDFAGIPRNTDTFNVLITNLCKLRKTEQAVRLFERMGEWGCAPDATTYLVLIRSLYQAARIGEGDEMIDKMKSAGFEKSLDKKEYYGFLKILCGIERVDHAMKVFTKMKKDSKPGVKTYDLLMGKLCAHGQVERANALLKEAKKRGIPVEPKPYKLDPRFAKKPKVKKSEKPKRETLPEKMARKRKTLRKLRLSFVKKPKKAMRRAF